MFKINNKNTKTTSMKTPEMTLTLNVIHTFSSISTVVFEQVILQNDFGSFMVINSGYIR